MLRRFEAVNQHHLPVKVSSKSSKLKSEHFLPLLYLMAQVRRYTHDDADRYTLCTQ